MRRRGGQSGCGGDVTLYTSLHHQTQGEEVYSILGLAASCDLVDSARTPTKLKRRISSPHLFLPQPLTPSMSSPQIDPADLLLLSPRQRLAYDAIWLAYEFVTHRGMLLAQLHAQGLGHRVPHFHSRLYIARTAYTTIWLPGRWLEPVRDDQVTIVQTARQILYIDSSCRIQGIGCKIR